VTRIGASLTRLKAERKKAFVAFITAGDPSLARTVELAVELAHAGVDVLELGVPFSDPIADGPVIQRSSERALARGVTLPRVIETIGRIRERCEIPIVLFSYFNPLLQYGLPRLARDLAAAGGDGVLATDLPPEEAEEWLTVARGAGLDTVFLAAPTSPPDRLERIARASSGFVYAVSRTGITGERTALSGEAAPLVAALRALTAAPVILGFGISTPQQVAEAARHADGVVVGSSLVRFLEEHPEGDLAGHVRWLRESL
jgi:tryptophan synthase alpha chain